MAGEHQRRTPVSQGEPHLRKRGGFAFVEPQALYAMSQQSPYGLLWEGVPMPDEAAVKKLLEQAGLSTLQHGVALSQTARAHRPESSAAGGGGRGTFGKLLAAKRRLDNIAGIDNHLRTAAVVVAGLEAKATEETEVVALLRRLRTSKALEELLTEEILEEVEKTAQAASVEALLARAHLTASAGEQASTLLAAAREVHRATKKDNDARQGVDNVLSDLRNLTPRPWWFDFSQASRVQRALRGAELRTLGRRGEERAEVDALAVIAQGMQEEKENNRRTIIWYRRMLHSLFPSRGGPKGERTGLALRFLGPRRDWQEARKALALLTVESMAALAKSLAVQRQFHTLQLQDHQDGTTQQNTAEVVLTLKKNFARLTKEREAYTKNPNSQGAQQATRAQEAAREAAKTYYLTLARLAVQSGREIGEIEALAETLHEATEAYTQAAERLRLCRERLGG